MVGTIKEKGGYDTMDEGQIVGITEEQIDDIYEAALKEYLSMENLESLVDAVPSQGAHDGSSPSL